MMRAQGLWGLGRVLVGIAVAVAAAAPTVLAADSPRRVPLTLDDAKHETVDADGVPIHAVSLGAGPLVVMLHGFPDYWYTWRDLMPELARDHHVVAIDLRGYNRSGQPAGVASYAMPRLVEDVAAVVRHFGAERATIVGHDWGGAIAWSVAMTKPEIVERLVIMNVPHPNGLARELSGDTEQRANSDYARRFQAPDAHESLTAVGLASWVREPDARRRYVEAFERSDFEAMLHFYRANYPRLPKPSSDGKGRANASGTSAPASGGATVSVPVLVIHGLDDPYLLAAGLNGTWEWIAHELTIVTIPGVGHFVHREAPERVRTAVAAWMRRPVEPISSRGN